MKRIFCVTVIVMLCAPIFAPMSANANERIGGVAIGALAGAVVLGPIGAIAGAAIGYGAGSAVANSRTAAPRRREETSKPPRQNAAVQRVPLPQAVALPKTVPLPKARPAALEAHAQAVPPVARQASANTPTPPAKPAAAAKPAATEKPHRMRSPEWSRISDAPRNKPSRCQCLAGPAPPRLIARAMWAGNGNAYAGSDSRVS